MTTDKSPNALMSCGYVYDHQSSTLLWTAFTCKSLFTYNVILTISLYMICVCTLMANRSLASPLDSATVKTAFTKSNSSNLMDAQDWTDSARVHLSNSTSHLIADFNNIPSPDNHVINDNSQLPPSIAKELLEAVATDAASDANPDPGFGATYSPTMLAFAKILYGVVCVVGLCGNTLVIYVVLRFSKMQTVTNMYILNLALADEMFLVGLPFLIATLTYRYWAFGWLMCKIYMTITSINQFTSSLLLTVMSADRYIAVCHPISSPRYRTPFIAKVICSSVWALSVYLMIPIFIFADVQQTENRISCNIYWPELDLMNGQRAFTLYSFTLGFFIPLLLILLFYFLVICKLRSISTKHRSREKRKTHRKVTYLVLTVITAYVGCWLPYWIGQVYITFLPPNYRHPDVTFTLLLLAGCLSYTNSAVNPILYAFLSENFKKSFAKAFMCAGQGDVNAQLHAENSVFPGAAHSGRQSMAGNAIGIGTGATTTISNIGTSATTNTTNVNRSTTNMGSVGRNISTNNGNNINIATVPATLATDSTAIHATMSGLNCKSIDNNNLITSECLMTDNCMDQISTEMLRNQPNCIHSANATMSTGNDANQKLYVLNQNQHLILNAIGGTSGANVGAGAGAGAGAGTGTGAVAGVVNSVGHGHFSVANADHPSNSGIVGTSGLDINLSNVNGASINAGAELNAGNSQTSKLVGSLVQLAKHEHRRVMGRMLKHRKRRTSDDCWPDDEDDDLDDDDDDDYDDDEPEEELFEMENLSRSHADQSSGSAMAYAHHEHQSDNAKPLQHIKRNQSDKQSQSKLKTNPSKVKIDLTGSGVASRLFARWGNRMCKKNNSHASQSSPECQNEPHIPYIDSQSSFDTNSNVIIHQSNDDHECDPNIETNVIIATADPNIRDMSPTLDNGNNHNKDTNDNMFNNQNNANEQTIGNSSQPPVPVDNSQANQCKLDVNSLDLNCNLTH